MKKLLLLLTLLISASPFLKAEYVDFNSSTFRDENFRAYLEYTYPSYINDGKIFIDYIDIIDISHGSNYRWANIESLEGIKYFKNLKALFLPGRNGNANNTRFKLQTVDVSGLDKLEVIDNGVYYTYPYFPTVSSKKYYSISNDENSDSGFTHSIDPNNGTKGDSDPPLTSVNAEGCTALKYVALGSLDNLKSINLKGCPNIETLYIYENKELESIDISEMEKLSNRKKIEYKEFEAVGATKAAYTIIDNSDNHEDNFILSNLASLKEFKVGPKHENLKFFMMVGTFNALKELDVTGMPNLEHFIYYGGTGSLATTTVTPKPNTLNYDPAKVTHPITYDVQINNFDTKYSYRGETPLTKLTLPSEMSDLKLFVLRHTRLTHLDVSSFCNSVELCDVQCNYLVDFDVESFGTNLKSLSLGNNCIYELGVIPTSVTYFCYNMNRLTAIPDHGRPMKNSSIKLGPENNNAQQFQQHRFVPKEASSYKCFEDISLLDHVMLDDAKLFMTSSVLQKVYLPRLYYAPYGGHFGQTTGDMSEDPLYFYFDEGVETAWFYMEFNVYPSLGLTSAWDPKPNGINFNPTDVDTHNRKYNSRYHKVFLHRMGTDIIDEEWENSKHPQEPEVKYTEGGLIVDVTAHYGGVGDVWGDTNGIIRTHSQSWQSGEIFAVKDAEDVYLPDFKEYDPESHAEECGIDYPKQRDNLAPELMVAKDKVSTSLVVDLKPDKMSSNRSALVSIDILGANGLAPLSNEKGVIFYQVYSTPETSELQTLAANELEPETEETIHNESDLAGGTKKDFEPDFEWNHPEVAAKTATVELPVSFKLYEAYTSLAQTNVGRVNVYVLEEAEALSLDAASALVEGDTASPDYPKYLYSMSMPVTIDTNVATGIEDILAGIEGSDAPVEYYTITGMRTDASAPGLYIRKQGNITSKVIIR